MTEEPANPPELPPNAVPYLLVMPSNAAVTWPGPDGQPAWAIPVTIAPGTPGYTVFVPLVPGAVQPLTEAPPEPVTSLGCADVAP